VLESIAPSELIISIRLRRQRNSARELAMQPQAKSLLRDIPRIFHRNYYIANVDWHPTTKDLSYCPAIVRRYWLIDITVPSALLHRITLLRSASTVAHIKWLENSARSFTKGALPRTRTNTHVRQSHAVVTHRVEVKINPMAPPSSDALPPRPACRHCSYSQPL
jgi:hypothetical protein